MGAVVNRESAPAAPPAMSRSIGARVSVAADAEAAGVEAIPPRAPLRVRGLAVRPPLRHRRFGEPLVFAGGLDGC